MNDNENNYLKAAADVVFKTLSDNPDIGIPVDPDVADFMGAFEEKAIDMDDVEYDQLFTVDEEGEVIFHE